MNCNMLAEFLKLLASEANEVCNSQQRQVISPEDVLEAVRVSECAALGCV